MSAAAGPEETRKPSAAPRKRRRLRLIGLACLLAMTGSLALYLRSDSFHEAVRRRVVNELQSVTGGEVEIQSLSWRILRLEFDLKGLTIHGEEGRDQKPYLHADRLTARARISSLFSQRIGLRSLTIEHPVVHLIIGPDGTTNQPAPRTKEPESNPVQTLFDLDIRHVLITSGELLINEKKFPFDLSGDQFAATLYYSRTSKTYEGIIAAGTLSASYMKRKPVQGDLDISFLLRPARAEISQFRFKTQQSMIEAEGTVSNFVRPEIAAQYRASIDLKELGGSIDLPELSGGRADLEGKGNYGPGTFGMDGKIAIHELAWRNAAVRITGMELASPFAVTQERITAPQITARLFDGNAQGDFEVTNWNVPLTGKKAPAQRGTISLRFSGMQLGQMAAAVSTDDLPLDRINPVGAASGEVKASWQGPVKNMQAEVKLEVVPPSGTGPQQVPVSAQMQAVYHGASQSLDVAHLSVATRGIRLTMAGSLGGGEAQLKTDFTASDLREIRPLLVTAFPGARIPLDAAGRARFNGAIYGKLRAPSARGHLEAGNFDLLAEPGWLSSREKETRRYHFDSLASDLNYTPAGLTAQNGTLKHGASQINFSGSVALVQGRFDENRSEISAALRLQNAEASDLQALAGLSYPLTGSVNASLRFSGTLHNLRGGGSLQAARITIAGEPFRSLRSDIELAGTEARFNHIVLVHDGEQITGSTIYDMASRRSRFEVNGSDIDLASLRRFLPGWLVVTGRTDFHLAGSGIPDVPAIDGQLKLRKLVINGETVGDLNVTAETHGAEMAVRASSGDDGFLRVDGNIQLRKDFPGTLVAKFERFDFNPLLPANLPIKITGHSSMDGTIEFNGPMRSPQNLNVTGNVGRMTFTVENLKIQNDGPVRFSMAGGVARIDQLRLTGADTDLSTHGEWRLTERQRLDLRVDGRMNIKLVQRFYPDTVTYGVATLAVHVFGAPSQPQMLGTVDIKDAGIAFVDMPNGLSQINGRLLLNQDRLQIEKLSAHTGGGVLDLGGFIDYRSSRYFDVTATGKDIRLRYPPGISASADATLRYTGTPQSSLLSGDIRVIRFAIDPHFDFAQYLARKGGPRSTQSTLLDNLRLDVHVVTIPELRVETSLAKFSGDADLRIRGTAANPALLGRVNIAEGNLSFSGTRYRLERGDITFVNPQLIQPVVNVEMSARVRGYDITLGFHGPLEKLSMTYRSEPPLPSGDIIALLAFGRTRQQDLYSSQQGQPLTASDTMLSQAINSASSSRVQKLFGAGSVKIDPQQTGGAENAFGPRVTIEQQIKDNVTLTYITNLSQSSQEQVIQAEINVTRNISIVAVRDQNGILGFDLRIRKRKK